EDVVKCREHVHVFAEPGRIPGNRVRQLHRDDADFFDRDFAAFKRISRSEVHDVSAMCRVTGDEAGQSFGIDGGSGLAVKGIFVVAESFDVIFDLSARVFPTEQHALLPLVALSGLQPAKFDARARTSHVAKIAMREWQSVVDDGANGYCLAV